MTHLNKFTGVFFLFVLLWSTTVFAQSLQNHQLQVEEQEITDVELLKFGKAFQQIQVVGRQAQQDIIKIYEKEGLEVPRFNEIYKATVKPEIKINTSGEEYAQHRKIVAELESIQMMIQQKIEEVIINEGLSLEKYEKIASGLEGDPKLQQRFQGIIKG